MRGQKTKSQKRSSLSKKKANSPAEKADAPKKSAYDTFQEAYEKNPQIVKKFILWKIAIFLILLGVALLINHYFLTPYFQSLRG